MVGEIIHHNTWIWFEDVNLIIAPILRFSDTADTVQVYSVKRMIFGEIFFVGCIVWIKQPFNVLLLDKYGHES